MVISSNGNKTFFSLTNFSLTPTEITATYNIKDSYGTILDNYTFLFNKDTNNNKYILNLKEPLKIKLSSESSKYLFISILKLTERLNQIKKRNKIKKQISSNANSNENNDNTEEEKELFGFNYVIHKRIDIKNFNINELKIENSDIKKEYFRYIVKYQRMNHPVFVGRRLIILNFFVRWKKMK